MLSYALEKALAEETPMSQPHTHILADRVYPFDARGIAKRFRHAAIFGALDSLGQVARDMEEQMHIVQCLETGFRNRTLLPSCVLKTALVEARASFLEALDRYTLADLAKPGTRRGGNAVLRHMSRHKALA